MLSVVIKVGMRHVEDKESVILKSIQLDFSGKQVLEMSMDIMGKDISSKGIK